MTDAKRLEGLLTVANEERWVDGEDPEAAILRSEKERVPMSRRQLMKRLRHFVDSETRIGVGRLGMKVREWTPRLQIDGFRSDLTDHELEGLRLEELRFILSQLLRGTRRSFPITISVAVFEGSESVSGQFPDVVLHLAMRLLADSGLTVGECEAPEAGDPGYPNAFDRPCAGLFITKRSGERRRRFCTNACKTRAKNPKWEQRLKKLRGSK
jgi:hypothetical protein